MAETSSFHAAGDYIRIEKALRYIQSRAPEQPELKDIARSVHLSEFHFQRMFRRWAGITPKQFLQYLTLEHAKRALARSRSILDAAYDAGLSGPGRMHDLFIAGEGMTPGEFKRKGQGLEIEYGFAPTPFGEALIASAPRGICALWFVTGKDRAAAVSDLRARWPEAFFRANHSGARKYARKIFSGGQRLPLFVRGTNFQLKVWEALLSVPEGCVVSYETLAEKIGRPGACRAVGNAVGANPLGYLIPCHRVIRSMGIPGHYRWGAPRKRAMLAWEQGRRAKP